VQPRTRTPKTAVAKRAASVQVEHVHKLRKLDQKLYGTDLYPATAPGPLLRRFQALGEVHPIAFGASGEGPSAGMEVLIGRLADACMGATDRGAASPQQRARRGGHREASYAKKSERPAGLRLGVRVAPGRLPRPGGRGTGRHRAFGGTPPRRCLRHG
jgi:hypothetical protein